MNRASLILQRISTLINTNSDNDLANELGVARSTLSTWRNRDTVPYEQCEAFAKRKNISLDWLLTGEGDIYKPIVKAVNDDLSLQERALLDMFRDLPDDEKTKVVGYIQDKKRFEDVARMLNQLLKAHKTA